VKLTLAWRAFDAVRMAEPAARLHAIPLGATLGAPRASSLAGNISNTGPDNTPWLPLMCRRLLGL
jgi:hypothetical protein